MKGRRFQTAKRYGRARQRFAQREFPFWRIEECAAQRDLRAQRINLQGQDLTLKQENFVSEYLRDLNATRAAIRAGYSPKTAAQAASRLLRNVKISAVVRREKDLRARRLQISGDMVVQRLTQIARTNIHDFLDFQPDGTFRIDFLKASPEQAAGVARLTVTEHTRRGKIISKTESLRLADRVRALELLGKHLGLFKGNGDEEHAEFARSVKQLIEALGLDRLTDDERLALEAVPEKSTGPTG